MRARREGAARAPAGSVLSDPYVMPLPRTRIAPDTAVPFYDMRAQADAGDPLACLQYGWALSRSEHGLQLALDKARTYFQRAADLATSGDKAAAIAGEALHSLAQCSTGAAAGDALARAAELGHARSRLELALLRKGDAENDDPEVEALLLRAADQGLPDAMVHLAAWLRQRRAPLPDEPAAELRREEAAAWLRKAASLGCAEAQFRLALMLLAGLDGDPDEDWVTPLASNPRRVSTATSSDALVLLKRAASRCHVAAQLRLGVALGDTGQAWASCISLSRCAMSPEPSPHRAMAGLLLGRAYLSGTGVSKSCARGVVHLQRVVQEDNAGDAAAKAATAELGTLACSGCCCPCCSACPDCDAELVCPLCQEAHHAAVHAPQHRGSSSFSSDLSSSDELHAAA